METNESETVKNLKRLTTLYFKTLKPRTDNSNEYFVPIKIQNHFELGCIISDMLKLCILALDHDMHNVPEKKNQSINVSLILETVLQLFPLDEMEFLGYVGEVIGE
ncbi:hypothetical protein L1276_001317 [Flavobacterium sp. HSC-32F16]|uniref:hypothetical protein n=1 Tax=Flavobacterium sp. HSC-32F16 TaxID=2910964 RepID=UPI0020A2F9CB|nr:hypothetical protein [Flavobacterium sp. HSC-32F16]MCP2026177.1 hypothetical protein [Flavobacterium sp. HSC-32F16]